MHFCDTSKVSDLILQCASSHVDFQALQFYAINCHNLNEFCFALSTFQVSGKQIHNHDIEVPAALFQIVNMVVTPV